MKQLYYVGPLLMLYARVSSSKVDYDTTKNGGLLVAEVLKAHGKLWMCIPRSALHANSCSDHEQVSNLCSLWSVATFLLSWWSLRRRAFE